MWAMKLLLYTCIDNHIVWWEMTTLIEVGDFTYSVKTLWDCICTLWPVWFDRDGFHGCILHAYDLTGTYTSCAVIHENESLWVMTVLMTKFRTGHTMSKISYWKVSNAVHCFSGENMNVLHVVYTYHVGEYLKLMPSTVTPSSRHNTNTATAILNILSATSFKNTPRVSFLEGN